MAAKTTGPDRRRMCSHFGCVKQDEYGTVYCEYCGRLFVPTETRVIEFREGQGKYSGTRSRERKHARKGLDK